MPHVGVRVVVVAQRASIDAVDALPQDVTGGTELLFHEVLSLRMAPEVDIHNHLHAEQAQHISRHDWYSVRVVTPNSS